jgi:predicted peptidase
MNRYTALSLAASLALTVLFGSLTLPAVGDVETGFINGQVTANGKTMVYVVYVPRDYSPAKQWPVILFLHQSTIEGHDGFLPLFTDLPRGGNATPANIAQSMLTGAGSLGVAVMRNPQRFPCLVVWPELPSAGSWSGIYNDLALRALEEVVEKYNGDRNRLYLTGISLGGAGTWTLAAVRPDLFAAAMPIAGGGNPATMAPALKSLPIWVFHGGADMTVSPASDRAMVAAIQAEGNPNIKYTEYPGLGHNVWDMAYDDPAVIAWLLAQKR